MTFVFEALGSAWDLIVSGDELLLFIVWVTVKVAAIATFVAVLVGIPVGLVLGLGRFRGRGPLLVLANMGLGLPPIVVGIVLVVLMYPSGPLGSLKLLYTLNGVYVAQTCLSTPLMIALTASAVNDLPHGLVDQARAFGAGRLRIGVLAVREARIGIFAAVLAAVGSALSEVGALLLVGGNSYRYNQTLATAAIERWDTGDVGGALGIGIILLFLILIITAILTWLQYGRRNQFRIRAS